MTAIRRQRPIKGGRERMTASAEGAIKRAVEAEARRFNCSKSFVQNVCVAEALGLDVESYVTEDKPRRRRRGAVRITLPNGVVAKPHSVKCYRPACRRVKRGWLTTRRTDHGGGAFYDKRGALLADLREVEFACNEHGIADGSSPFLYPDKEEK